MRKFLMLMLLALVCAGASGCMSGNPCGQGWHPGAMFQHNQTNGCCCESSYMSAPVMQAPCCQ